MAFKPSISISLSDSKCNTLCVREETGIYVAGQNEKGWGTPNIDTNAVVSASVLIYDLFGSVVHTFIIKDLTTNLYANAVSNPTPSEFLLAHDLTWTSSDGVFKVEYIVFDGTTYYNSHKQYVLFLCNLCNCINNVKSKYVTTCDKTKKNLYYEQFKELELLKYGVESAAACGNFEDATTILKSATKICVALSDCGCGCSDC